MFVQNHRTPDQAKHLKLSHLTDPRPAPVNKKTHAKGGQMQNRN